MNVSETTEKSMEKINCVVFGLSGVDTSPIVRHMKKSDAFGNVIWFGIVDGVDFNTYAIYNYQKDYDTSITLPDGYYEHMEQALGRFFISSARRNEANFREQVSTLSFGSTYEYLHHFNRYCYLVYDLLTKNDINLVIVDGVPHTSLDIMLCQAASFFGIKQLFLYQPNIPNKFMYFSELDGKAIEFSLYFDEKKRPKLENYTDYKVKYPETPFYMRDFSQYFYTVDKFTTDITPFVDSIFGRIIRRLKLNFSPKNPGIAAFFLAIQFFKHHKNPKKLKSLASLCLKHASYQMYEKNLNDLSIKSPDLTQKYVYFPLNFQPELTTECLGKDYTDILTAVEKLHAFLPNDYLIYVKDHVIQYEFGRDQIFFDRLKTMDRVVLVDRMYSSFKLIENSQFVTSLNGTAGLEALHMGKKALNFGTIYFEGLPGVSVYRDSLSFSEFHGVTFTKDDLEQAINDLISRMETGIVNADYSAMVKDFDPDQNAEKVSDFICRFYHDTLHPTQTTTSTIRVPQ